MGVEKKRIAVVTIGGTFFMKGSALSPGKVDLPPLRTSEGLPRELFEAFNQPSETGRVRRAWQRYGSPIRPGQIEIEHHPLFNIDSSQIRVKHLNKLGKKLAELSNNKDVDGVVVISGTDKLHRLVTRLAHHLQGLNKPVVFTGAQIPINQQGSDARRNYEQAVRAAYSLSDFDLNQVFLCFGRGQKELGGEIHHPLNALKADPNSLDAFNHPHKRVVGTVLWGGGLHPTGFGLSLVPREVVKFREKTRRKLTAGLTLAQIARMPKEVDHVLSAVIKAPLYIHDTTFTKIREDFADTVEIQETKSLGRFRISGGAKVIVLKASGKGNVRKSALEAVTKRAAGRPVVVCTEAGADVDLASYEPGVKALQSGMIPSGGLIPVSAEIRAEYLAHHMETIDRYARQKAKPDMAVEDFKRRLFAALYLSGARFKGRETKAKHEKALGIKIANRDFLINTPIEDALMHAHLAIKKFEKEKQPRFSFRKRHKRSQMIGPNVIDKARKDRYLTGRPFPSIIQKKKR